ncbi:MAG: hypothetical protein B6U76_02425 [Desulfurococcales archaeon ex4484_217_2]|nr:MAG: hypothetical protein B6U76_02425 [Desulfurococcales archaeon ex4484_217_2]
MSRRLIVHFSHTRLPDPRIERIGFLEKHYLNHELIYVGSGGQSKIFADIITVKWNIDLVIRNEEKITYVIILPTCFC